MTTSVLAVGVLEETIRAFFQGLPIGAGFALVAMSFVLTYKTSGVFNLAFGAQAFISAAVYFELHLRRDWPIWAAVLMAVVLVAPVLGLLLERLIFRHIHAVSAVAKLVISLGLMVALPELFKLAVDYNREQPFGAVGIIPDGTTVYRMFGRYPVTRDEIAAFVIMVAAALALAALFRYSRLGLRIRAVVQSPRMTELNGVNADLGVVGLVDAVQPLRRSRRSPAGAHHVLAGHGAGAQRLLPDRHRRFGRGRAGPTGQPARRHVRRPAVGGDHHRAAHPFAPRQRHLERAAGIGAALRDAVRHHRVLARHPPPDRRGRSAVGGGPAPARAGRHHPQPGA